MVCNALQGRVYMHDFIAKKLMLAAMTSEGVIAGQHRNVVTTNGSTRAQSYVENQGNELKGQIF